MKDPRVGAIFDMDGVLIDSTEAHFLAWRILGGEIGKVHAREFFDGTFGMHNREILPLWLGEGLPRDEIERLSVRKEEIFRSIAADLVKPMEGALDLLRSLADDGFLLAVGTSGLGANVELVLDLLGVRGRFAAYTSGDDVKVGKPDPEVFLRAAAKLSLEPRRCVVIEDSPQGVEAGLAAGAGVVALASTRPREELGAAHRIVGSLRDLDPAGLRSVIDGVAFGAVGPRGAL